MADLDPAAPSAGRAKAWKPQVPEAEGSTPSAADSAAGTPRPGRGTDGSMTDDDIFFRDILDHLYDGVYFVDRERRITYWNKGAERITGYGAAEVAGRRCSDNLLSHVDEAGGVLCLGRCPLAQAIEDGQVREAEVYLKHASGHRVPVRVRVAPLRGPDGAVVGAVESFSDNSQLMAARHRVMQLNQLVERDPLTGLGNRRYLERKLEAALWEARQTGMACAVLFADVDHFKRVNDTHGHAVGDGVLQMVAETLRLGVRAADCVARWGGEEFVVIMMDVDPAHLPAIANKLRTLAERSSFSAPDGRVQVTLSLGATTSRPGDTVETILQRADALLYQSKLAGRNRVTLDAPG